MLSDQDGLYRALKRSLDLASQGPLTLLHGDSHIGNTYPTASGRMGFTDWQIVLRGSWAYDVAYTITSGLDTDDRRAWEHELLAFYLERLAATVGDRAPDFDSALLAYRQQALYPYFIWLATIGRSPIQPKYQPDEVSRGIIGRTARAVQEDLDVLGALGGTRLKGSIAIKSRPLPVRPGRVLLAFMSALRRSTWRWLGLGRRHVVGRAGPTAIDPRVHRSGAGSQSVINGDIPSGCPLHNQAVPLYGQEVGEKTWEQLRAQFGSVAPVQVEPGVAAWLVLGYNESVEVLRNPSVYSHDPRGWREITEGRLAPDSPLMPIFGYRPNVLYADGPEHQRLRAPIVDSLARLASSAYRATSVPSPIN